MLIPSQRHLFDIPDDIAYLNCAYMSPLAKALVEIGRQAMAAKARPWTLHAPDFFDPPEQGRALFAELINASADDICYVPAASYGLAIAARNLPLARHQRIVLLQDQFPSNVYMWRELAAQAGARLDVLPRPSSGPWTGPILEALGDDAAILACGHCHWTDGRRVDLVEVGARCRQHGTALVLDLTQSIGAMPFDVREVQPDFAVAAAYKWMLGPYSMGFCYLAPAYHQGVPLEHSWIARRDSEDFANLLNYQDAYQPGARRFDVGERSNFALVPPLTAALRQLLDWGVENTAETLAVKTARIGAAAAELGLVPSQPSERAGHFLGLRFPGAMPDGLLERLAADRVYLSVRGDSLRVTPHLYNTEADEARLLMALAAVLGR